MKNGVKNIQTAAYNGACTVYKKQFSLAMLTATLYCYWFKGTYVEEQNFCHVVVRHCARMLQGNQMDLTQGQTRSF